MTCAGNGDALLSVLKAGAGVGVSRKKLTGALDVALMQSLVLKGAADDRLTDCGHLVVDECHHISAHSFEQVARQLHVPLVQRLPRAPEQALELGRKVVVRIVGATELTDTVRAAPVAECYPEPCVERGDVLQEEIRPGLALCSR